MELWVRSQDKEFLVKVERVYYYREHLTEPDGVVHRITTGEETLGRYATKERCLEILDEMQLTMSHWAAMIYQMPEE